MQTKKNQFPFALSAVTFTILLVLSYKQTSVLDEQLYSALSLVSGVCMLRVVSGDNQLNN